MKKKTKKFFRSRWNGLHPPTSLTASTGGPLPAKQMAERLRDREVGITAV
jgi:hypothetical protein